MASKFMPKIEAISVGGTKAMVASESAFKHVGLRGVDQPEHRVLQIGEPRLHRFGDALEFADVARQRRKALAVEAVAAPDWRARTPAGAAGWRANRAPAPPARRCGPSSRNAVRRSVLSVSSNTRIESVLASRVASASRSASRSAAPSISASSTSAPVCGGAEARGGAALADVERARTHLAHGDQLALDQDEGDRAGLERALVAAPEQRRGQVQRVAFLVEARRFLERGALGRRRHVDAERGLDARLFGVVGRLQGRTRARRRPRTSFRAPPRAMTRSMASHSAASALSASGLGSPHSFLCVVPRAMTKRTFISVATSWVGSPSTAMMSAE